MRSATRTRSTHTNPSKVEPLDRSSLRLSPFSRPGSPLDLGALDPLDPMGPIEIDVPLHSRWLSELPLVLTVVLLFVLATFL